MNNILILPILVPLLSAALTILVRDNLPLQRRISLIGMLILFITSFFLAAQVLEHDYLVSYIGGWQAPYGIALVADLLAAIMILFAGLIGFSVVLYSLLSCWHEEFSAAFHPLIHFLLMGVCGAFLTGDIFNLYVCFEIILMASFALLTLEGRAEQTEGAVKYVVLNLLSSAIFLAGLGLLYAKTGTLNMADISLIAQQATVNDNAGPIRLAGLLFFISFSVKSAMFPFFFWLPASYHTPSVPVSALFAGLLTKVGVYALIRLYTLMMPGDILNNDLLLTMGVATMLIGVFGAASQMHIRRILSFHIISQIGYIAVGIAINTALSLAAAIFFIIHNMIAKSNLFLVGGIASQAVGSENLYKTGGMWKAWPQLGLIYLISAFALAGFPPLSGFIAKFSIVWAIAEAQLWWVMAAAIFTGLLTLYSMVKIWAELFWKDHPNPEWTFTDSRDNRRLIPVSFLALFAILLGVGGGPLFELCLRAGEQLTDPTHYIQAVLGEAR
ncbi:MAG: Na+/H+ antiporter subunit D [Methyloprofundus sp.]|nr:Na+/H+ antiporter subunit D [Methyloprofundus sp.]